MSDNTALKAPPVLDIPDAEPANASHIGPVDSPATPSSQSALARFEFEIGRGNEGTKILMVEWSPSGQSLADGSLAARTGPETPEEPDQRPAQKQEQQDGWEVSWEGKKTTFSLSERDSSSALQRVFFLLPANVTIPPVVTIAQPSTGRTLSTKPLPAIFAPGLGIDTEDAGKRGVLHTVWAKKRLSQLQEEIELEMQHNIEGVALEMVTQEREWLVEHFGLDDPTAAHRSASQVAVPPTPQSPRSPVAGRLGQKLRGLKLATSPTELASTATSDIAVPSRSAFTQQTNSVQGADVTPVVVSLNAVVDDGNSDRKMESDAKQNEDELFALPMSPRSPDMKKSPFSFL